MITIIKANQIPLPPQPQKTPHMTDQNLFTAYTLGSLTLANRIVLAPLTRNRAGTGLVPSEFAPTYYSQRASAGLLITEAIVPVPVEGQGIASRMAKHVLADIRARGLVILPTCPFFARYLQKHPAEYADIVHPSYRVALGI